MGNFEDRILNDKEKKKRDFVTFESKERNKTPKTSDFSQAWYTAVLGFWLLGLVNVGHDKFRDKFCCRCGRHQNRQMQDCTTRKKSTQAA
jgi:hypothetical protein